MASIGVNLAARLAGKTPKKTPMTPETEKATTTDKRLMATGKKDLTARTIRLAKSRPSKPPKTDKTTASDKN